jgi:hypothetical protein
MPSVNLSPRCDARCEPWPHRAAPNQQGRRNLLAPSFWLPSLLRRGLYECARRQLGADGRCTSSPAPAFPPASEPPVLVPPVLSPPPPVARPERNEQSSARRFSLQLVTDLSSYEPLALRLIPRPVCHNWRTVGVRKEPGIVSRWHAGTRQSVVDLKGTTSSNPLHREQRTE